MTVGRPTKYSEAIAKEICERLCNGENLADICKLRHIPERQNIWCWRLENIEFRDMINTCLQIKGEATVDSMDEIEQQMISGEIEAPVGNAILTNRRWKASKFYPRMFGEKSTVESTNVNLNANVEIPLSEADMAILSRFGFSDNS